MAETLAATARRFYEQGWGAGDRRVVDRICVEDMVDQHHGTTGRDALWATVASLRATFPDLAVIVRNQLTQADMVVSELTMSGSDTGGLFSLPASNLLMEIEVIFIDRFHEGRIVEHRGLSDMWGMLRQLHVVPPTWKGDRLSGSVDQYHPAGRGDPTARWDRVYRP